MGTVNWAVSQSRYISKRAEIDANATGSGWLHFLDALGYMESSNSYFVTNGSFRGKYQIGLPLLGNDIVFCKAGVLVMIYLV